MHSTNRRLIPVALFLTGSLSLLAQAGGESPYSSSTVDAPAGESFFESYGVALICVIVFVALLGFVVLRGRSRS